ncbi:MAG: hypothetical protein LBH19_00445 [Dysgonamonadaceae bacterium]|jgi:hypothetical protein|nr:hypothetical protein [Dysgonamonadaceae bacterium]
MIKKTFIFLMTATLFASCCNNAATQQNVESQSPEKLYDAMQRGIAKGWNTWDTRSVLTHVLLPAGAAIDLNLSDRAGARANTFQIGDRKPDAPLLRPGAHTYDGAYTDIEVEWHNLKLRIQSAADEMKNVIVVTPLEQNARGGKLIVSLKSLWQRCNTISASANKFAIRSCGEDVKLEGTVIGNFIGQNDKEIIVSTDETTVITCGADMTIDEAKAFVDNHFDSFVKAGKEKFGEYYEVYNAMQNVLSWDNIFDPTIRKVITPVSRIWNVGWSCNPSLGGFVLFCWDTYFASMMLATGNRELAYANAVEITRGVTEAGFVPNFYTESDYKSRDRSQPPVGSLAAWTIYSKYKEKWFLELLYDNLLSWNRWWDKNRNIDGLLCWGSTPFEKVTYHYWEFEGVNETYGGALESGLDNSHMYDNVPFDKEKHMQMLNDAGLSGLYIMDCNLLAKIADELGRSGDSRELRQRSKQYAKNISKLWDEERGLYYNLHTDSKEFDSRISPTNFYPMLAGAPTQQQAERMVKEHLMNPEEFWGEWIIPATPRNDPAFNDNAYWRGRIWAPLNFLVYMGLRNYDLPEARKQLSEKSKNLLLKSWLKDRYVFENYNATTGVGDDVTSSDKFYHWGALLGFITLMEEGFFNEEMQK